MSIFRRYTALVIKRLYHDSRFRQRDPIAKLASGRVSRSVKRRLDNESTPRIEKFDPSRHFEPFPFAVTEENKFEALNRVLTPLHDIPYEEQLSGKESHCRNSLRYFAQQLYKSGTPVRLDVRRLPCPVHPIVRCPDTHHYRNKDEFSIWRGADGETSTIGHMVFPIGKHGDTVCVEPNGCGIVKEETVKVTDILQEFIRNQAKLPICYRLGDQGGWRRFIVRNNKQGELMVVGILNPRTLKVSEVLEERDNFKHFVVEKCRDSGLKLSSLQYQPCPNNKCSHKDVPYQLLFGRPTIQETINHLKIVISPETFAHQNTRGAEVFYDAVKNTLIESFSVDNPIHKPLVIDVKCGAGTLGLHLADLASKVIGIDASSQSIDDARENAKLNNVGNIEFINSHAEIVLERIVEKNSKNNDAIIVCDVPKSGLHKSVVQTIRDARTVRRMVYITPKADSEASIDDLLILCKRAGSGKSLPPFAPVSATPVDVYPQVEACPLIIALERLPE